MTEKNKNVLIGVTGSVATIKLEELTNKLLNLFNVQVVCTDKSKHFINIEAINVKVWSDSDEWESWKNRGDPVMHIELRKWADLLVIAPLDANSLAKIANGMADNLLTCVVRAWDFSKPLVFAPAMNTAMWNHPITAKQIGILKSWGYHECSVISKTLICGDTGFGAMAEVCDIINKVKILLNVK